MKNVKLLLIGLVGFLGELYCVNAASNPYKQVTSWGDVNCTWSTWQETYNRTGIALPGWGNAREWYDAAKNAGFAVGSEPKAKSIIVLDNYEDYGHVAYVDHINNGKVYVWDSVTCYREMTDEEYATWRECIYNNTTSADDEYLCDYLKVMEETTCEYSKENHMLDSVIGYIYVTETKTSNSSSSSSSSSNSSSSSTKNVEKSSNNYLKELSIEEVDISFDKEILIYNLEVLYDIEKINVNAVAEDTKATISMDNEADLDVGNNTFKIVVTAEDKSTREYVININRLDKEKIEEENIVDKIDKVEEKDKGLIGWVVGVLLTVAVIIIIIFIIRNKKINKKK